MNKIVCDVCGTSYPDTSVQCPICGTAKTDANKTSAGSEAGYAYVKGGRFSKANVRKRNAGQKELPRVVAPVKPKKEAPAQKQDKRPAAEKKQAAAPAGEKIRQDKGNHVSNRVLIAIAVLLVIAIIVVCVFIVKEQIAGGKTNHGNNGTTPQTTTTAATTVPCTELSLAVTSHTFTTAGDSFMIAVKKVPADTTDIVRYESADERIATVDEKGVVTALADGTVTIYVYCGDQMATFTVICEVGVQPGGDTQPTDPTPTDPTPTDPTEPTVVLELNRTEFTLKGYGASHNLYDGELDPATITWTSSNETVATVTNGKVVAVGNGTAVITAAYMGKTVTCTVHCAEVAVSDYKLGPDHGFGPDYTISVGDTLQLFLTDQASGLRIQAEHLSFSVSREGVISIDANGKVTALSAGTVTVTVTYGELSFKAIVRVMN